jgi:hypothetical protein
MVEIAVGAKIAENSMSTVCWHSEASSEFEPFSKS